MLSKEEELGLFEILKNNFPILHGSGLVIGISEFLSEKTDYKKFYCDQGATKLAAASYIESKIPYIVFDESEGYKCIFLRGNHVKIHFDATEKKVIRFVDCD